ncbi:mechanosensitive ion channel family protein [Halobium salinum]|uniref:Mechanosensitive ion channel family protein n=1 Tax=Halobium salinum TaxID=1364940 RepID=A0ABD5P7N0_9EURY|nr:mechanosensitive ion channel family protein [Halobium salinum]
MQTGSGVPTAEELLVRVDYGAFLTKLAVFVVAFTFVYLVGRLVAVPVADRALRARRVTPTVRNPASKAVRVAVVFVAFFAAMFFARLETLLSVTGGLAAALTLAVGFASRDVVGNLVGGLFIITDPKFNIGDWIAWGSKEGIIEDISFRATRVRTFRNELITVPNSTLANTVVTNHAVKDRLRIDVPYSVDLAGDVDAMREALLDATRTDDRILREPSPTVTVDEVTAAGVTLTSRFWLDSPTRPKYLDVYSDYSEAVKARVDREEVSLSPDYLELTGSVATGDELGDA